MAAGARVRVCAHVLAVISPKKFSLYNKIVFVVIIIISAATDTSATTMHRRQCCLCFKIMTASAPK